EKVVLPSERRESAVPSGILGQYVGTYRNLAPGLDLVITLEDGRLMSQVVGSNGYQEPKHALLPESDGAFFQKEFESEYTFVRDAKGAVSGVVFVSNGQMMKAAKQ
ncbi:MAG TPA: DUF3471 domain-containing protein, partial [candidate division Zixibacteria bacterium]|nr:DUF3471 domain-containing protein [candidate division Zixibacteria bacterium]